MQRLVVSSKVTDNSVLLRQQVLSGLLMSEVDLRFSKILLFFNHATRSLNRDRVLVEDH